MSENYSTKFKKIQELLAGSFDKKDQDALYKLFKSLEKKSLSNNFRRDSFLFSQGFEEYDAIQAIYVDESNIDEIYAILSEGLKPYQKSDMGSFFTCNFTEIENKNENVSLDFIQSVIRIRDLFQGFSWTEEQWEKISGIVRGIVLDHDANYDSAKVVLKFGLTDIYIDEETAKEVLPLLEKVAAEEKSTELLSPYKSASFDIMRNAGHGPLAAALYYVLFRNKSATFDEMKEMIESSPADAIDLASEKGSESKDLSEILSRLESMVSALPVPSSGEKNDAANYEEKLEQLRKKVKTLRESNLSCNADHKEVLRNCLRKLDAISSRSISSVSDSITVRYEIDGSNEFIRLPVNSDTIDEVTEALKELEENFQKKAETEGAISCSYSVGFNKNEFRSIDKIIKNKSKSRATLLAKITGFENLVGYVFDNGQVLFESVNYNENPTVYRISSSDLMELIRAGGMTSSTLLSSGKAKTIERILPGWSRTVSYALKKNRDGKVISDELVSLSKEKGIALEEMVPASSPAVLEEPVVEEVSEEDVSEIRGEIPKVIVTSEGYFIGDEKLTREKLEALRAGDPPITKVSLILGDEEREIAIDALLGTYRARAEEATESLDKTTLEYKKILQDRIKRCQEIISKLEGQKHKTDFTEIRIRGYKIEIAELNEMVERLDKKETRGVTSLLGSIREGFIEREKEKQNANLNELKGKELHYGLAKKFNERNIKSVQGRIDRLQKLDGFCGSIQRSLMCPRAMLAKLGRYSQVVANQQFYQEKVAENKEYKELLNEHKWRIFTRLGAAIQGVFYKWNASRYRYLSEKLTKDSSIIQYHGSRAFSLLRGTYKHEEIENAAEEALGR